MSQNPQLNANVIDPGSLAQPSNTSQIPIYAGVCQSGVDFEIVEFAEEDDLLAYGGAGHGIDVAQAALQFAKSVKFMKLPITTAGTFAATSSDDPLTATSFTGTPLQFLMGQIVITGSPAPGTTAISAGTVKAKISLDAWDIANEEPSFSDEFTIASTGIVNLPGTGGLAVHLTTSQTPAIGETLNFEVTPGHYNAASVASCQNPLLDPAAGLYTFICWTGEMPSASGANTVAQAEISLNTTFYGKGRYYLMATGTGIDTDAAVVTAFAATTMNPPFVSGGFGAGYWTSPRATPTRGRYALREHEVAAIRVSNIAISTDPGRAADGAIIPIEGVDYDAAMHGSLLVNANISALRSWHPDAEGYFINRQKMLAAAGSNFESWQFGAVMCVALRATRRALFGFVLDSLRRTSTGTLDPRDAADVQTACQNAIDEDLMTPENARGLPGHISARQVTVNLTTLLPALRVAVSLRPFGYPDDIEATVEYGNAGQ